MHFQKNNTKKSLDFNIPDTSAPSGIPLFKFTNEPMGFCRGTYNPSRENDRESIK